ncbi:MAG TPA: PepSY-associated TM helix domain-containing protein [Rhodopila sp.]|nr:PepSY-associated TM helix domain-containing protein [Rhodopila sp.]
MTRAVLRRLHRWIGLLLVLPLIIQAVTGLIMAADPFVAAIRDVPSSNGWLVEPDDLRGVDVAAVLAAARAAVPGDVMRGEVVPVRWRVEPGAIAAVDFAAPGRQQVVAEVGVDALFTTVAWVRRDPGVFYRWVHSVHETLLMGAQGRRLIGAIGIGLLLLGLFGIPLWWPRRGRWLAGVTVSRGASGWRLQRELHGAAGFWMLVVLLVQSVSGVAMAFPQTARAIVGLPDMARRGAHVGGDVRVDPVRSIVAGVASAQAALPEAVLLDLRLPAVPGRPMMAVLLPRGDWQGSPPAIVSMNRASGRVLSVQDPRASSLGVSALNWLRAWHEGGAGGPAGRVLLCVFALVLVLLPVTGLGMWVLRWRQRRRAATSRSRPVEEGV